MHDAIGTGPERRSRSIIAALVLASAGCSIGGGTSVGPMTAGDVVNLVQKADVRLHVAERNGAFFGAQGALSTPLGDACCSGWRALATGGYADVPAVDRSRFGVDLVALAGLARMPSADHSPAFGFAGGVQAALPVRVNPHRELWQSDDYVGSAWQLVPNMTALAFLPFEGSNKAANIELTAGFSFRVFLTSSVLP